MRNKTISNVIFSAGYQLLILFVPMITTPYITRIFSPSQMGTYATSLAVAGFFVVFSAFGLPLYGSREIAKTTKQNRTNVLYKFITLQAISSLFFFFLAILLISNLKVDRKIYYLQSLLILVNIFDISWFYIGIEEIKRTLYRNFLSKIFTMFSVFILVKTKNDLELYILLNVIGMLLGNLLMIAQAHSFVTSKFRFLLPSRSTIKEGFGILVPLLFTDFKNIFDRIILLSTTGSNSAVGIYDQSKKIINILIAISNSATIALMPKLTSTVQLKEGKIKFVQILNKVVPLIFMGSIFLAYSIYNNSVNFVKIFFGQGYSLVSAALNIFSFSLLFIPINNFILNGVILPNSNDKQYRIISVMSSMMLLLLNFILDWKFGLYGAVVSYFLTEFLSFMYMLYLLTKYKISSIFSKNFLISLVIYIFSMVSYTLFFGNRFISKNDFVNFVLNAILSTLYFTLVIATILFTRKVLHLILNKRL